MAIERTALERAAYEDYDRARAAYAADPSRENLAAYEAATWAAQAAVTRALELAERQDQMKTNNLTRAEAVERVARHVPREQAEHYVSMAGSGQPIPVSGPGLRPGMLPVIELVGPDCYSYRPSAAERSEQDCKCCIWHGDGRCRCHGWPTVPPQ